MANDGYLVRVTTLPIHAAAPMFVDYVVAEPDMVRAEEIVRVAMSSDEEVKALHKVPAAEIERRGLNPGEFAQYV
jgi:hypothetical protein